MSSFALEVTKIYS